MMRRLAALCLASIPVASAYAEDLMEIYQLAVQNDPEYRASAFNQSAAQEIKSQSIAQMLPNIGLTAASNRTRLNSEKTSYLGSGLQQYWDSTLSISLQQPVFNWSHWVQLDRADNKIAQADAEQQAKQQSLMTRTVTAYFNILSA
ncbi:MAG: TolC family protein, partial [Gammaproteobacteria bacterium]